MGIQKLKYGAALLAAALLMSNPLLAEKQKNVNVVNNPDVTISNMPDVNVANTPDVYVANMPDVVVVNGPSNPVSVEFENEALNVQITDEFFVVGDTVALSIGESFESEELFTVPSDKTLIIEYIDAFNATVSPANGQEARLRISYFSAEGGGNFPGASFIFRSTSSVNEAGGARVFLPVPPDADVSASIIRADDSVQTTYRVTVTGRLVPASP